MKMLKNKKDEADVFSNFAPLLLSAIIVLILVILFAGWMANFERKDAVNQITRKYILKMETTGGITDADADALKDELGQYCTNILLEYDGNKTTKEGEASYGEDVDLYVQADMYTYKFKIVSSGDTDPPEEGTVWQLQNVNGDVGTDHTVGDTTNTTTIQIHRSSTSKH